MLTRYTGLILVLMAVAVALAQSQDKEGCRVQITAPEAGSNVAIVQNVAGTGTVPPGKFLWVFAHRQGLANWWPEGGGPAKIRNGEWLVNTTFGTEQDSGADFEITAAVVDESTNAQLSKTVQDWARSNYYPGTTFPDYTCKSKEVIVKRK